METNALPCPRRTAHHRRCVGWPQGRSESLPLCASTPWSSSLQLWARSKTTSLKDPQPALATSSSKIRNDPPRFPPLSLSRHQTDILLLVSTHARRDGAGRYTQPARELLDDTCKELKLLNVSYGGRGARLRGEGEGAGGSQDYTTMRRLDAHGTFSLSLSSKSRHTLRFCSGPPSTTGFGVWRRTGA